MPDWRNDGSQVGPEEWRTGKPRDLLRLLALENGQVSEERARNSLRTATSRVRRATGTHCVARRTHGIVLFESWVDVVEYRELVARARGGQVGRGWSGGICGGSARDC